MPTYEYQCGACGHLFNKFQRITDDPVKECPSCGKEEVKRLVSAAAFHLKGSGWYKTDYASSSSSGSSSANKSEGSNKDGASKTDGGSDSTQKSGDSKGGAAKKEASSSTSPAEN